MAWNSHSQAAQREGPRWKLQLFFPQNFRGSSNYYIMALRCTRMDSHREQNRRKAERRRLEWLGNVTGMDQTRVAKKSFESKPEDRNCGKVQSEMVGRCRGWFTRTERLVKDENVRVSIRRPVFREVESVGGWESVITTGCAERWLSRRIRVLIWRSVFLFHVFVSSLFFFSFFCSYSGHCPSPSFFKQRCFRNWFYFFFLGGDRIKQIIAWDFEFLSDFVTWRRKQNWFPKHLWFEEGLCPGDFCFINFCPWQVLA